MTPPNAPYLDSLERHLSEKEVKPEALTTEAVGQAKGELLKQKDSISMDRKRHLVGLIETYVEKRNTMDKVANEENTLNALRVMKQDIEGTYDLLNKHIPGYEFADRHTENAIDQVQKLPGGNMFITIATTLGLVQALNWIRRKAAGDQRVVDKYDPTTGRPTYKKDAEGKYVMKRGVGTKQGLAGWGVFGTALAAIGGYAFFWKAKTPEKPTFDPAKDPEVGKPPESIKDSKWDTTNNTIAMPVRPGRTWMLTKVDNTELTTPTPATGNVIDLKAIPGRATETAKDIKSVTVKHILSTRGADGALAESGINTIIKPS